MTSSTEKSLAGNGASASEHDNTHDAEGLASLLAMIAQRALDREGKLVGSSAVLDALRSSDQREKLLREFVIAMQPQEVNPVLWEHWLSGGPSPFERVERLDTPAPGTMGISRAVERQDKAVQKARSALNKAHRAAETAQAKVAEAEKALQLAQAKDAAFLEYVMSDHLLSVMQPIQVMGPAWTVMRALTGHLESEVLKKELIGVKEAKHSEMEVIICSERLSTSEELLTALDLWCGDVDFEMELRKAIVAVVERFSKRERASETPRSLDAMVSSIRSKESRQQRRAILQGMSSAQP
jgi:hypothetical protein